jgi:hypothetical protein
MQSPVDLGNLNLLGLAKLFASYFWSLLYPASKPISLWNPLLWSSLVHEVRQQSHVFNFQVWSRRKGQRTHCTVNHPFSLYIDVLTWASLVNVLSRWRQCFLGVTLDQSLGGHRKQSHLLAGLVPSLQDKMLQVWLGTLLSAFLSERVAAGTFPSVDSTTAVTVLTNTF